MKKMISLVLAALLLLTAALFIAAPMGLSVHADTEEETPVSRMINVVYDDSRSMHLNSRKWWCYAKYSLEIFSAMMQDDDMMNVYYMSSYNNGPQIPGISGNRQLQQDNIERIHGTVTKTGGTPFGSISKAYDALKTASKDERWLVVITDGDSFNDHEGASDLDQLFSSAAQYKIKVVYLAISSDKSEAIVPSATENVFIYNADGDTVTGSNSILNRVTEICERIFQRPLLDDGNGKYYSNGRLTLSVPVSEVIILAQGENASVGKLDGAKKITATSVMRTSDNKLATTNGAEAKAAVADNLDGTIITFTPQNGDFINEGTYDLSINAATYTIYYKPCLDLVLHVKDKRGNLMTDKYIPQGSYDLEYWLTYPQGHSKYGEKITQKEFGESVDYTRTCSTNGKVRELSSNSVDLEEGSIEITVTAHYLEFISTSATAKYVAEDVNVEKLDLELEYKKQTYRLSELENEDGGIVVHIKKNGAPIPASDMERFNLTVNADKMDFETVKNSQDSSFAVYPRYYGGSKANTALGDVPIDFEVSASNDHRKTDAGAVSGKINVYSTDQLSLKLEYEKSEYRLSHLEDDDGGVIVHIEKNGKELSEGEMSAMQIEVKANGMDFRAVKNEAGSSFTLYPRYAGGERKNTASGEVPFDVEVYALDRDGDKTDTGNAAGKINVIDDVSSTNLVLTALEQDEHYNNKELGSQDPQRKVKITWNGEHLTRDQYDNLVLNVKVDSEYIDAQVELDPYSETEDVTATVKFSTVKGDDGSEPAPKHLVGNNRFTVDAAVEIDGERSVGEVQDALKVDEARSIWELLLDYLPLIIALLVILYLIIVYATKHYMPKKISYIGAGRHTIKPYRNAMAILTTIAPIPGMHTKCRLSLQKRGGARIGIVWTAGRGRKITASRRALTGARIVADGNPNATAVNYRMSTLQDNHGHTVIQFMP